MFLGLWYIFYNKNNVYNAPKVWSRMTSKVWRGKT